MHGNSKTRRNEPYRKRIADNERILAKHQPVEMSVEDMEQWALEQRGLS